MFVIHRTRGLALWVALPVVFLAPLLFPGCTGDEREREDSAVAVTAPSFAETPVPETDPAEVGPQPGTARVVVHDDGAVSISANAAPRFLVLTHLAAASGFLLESHIPSLGRLTTRMERVPLSEALPILVGNAEYQADWLFDPARDEHFLISVTIGTPPPPGADDADLVDVALQADEWGVTETLPEMLLERPASNFSSGELRSRLGDPDPRVRMEAAIEIDPDGEAFEDLVGLLANDPDPGVRAATTVSLENSDKIAAVNALLDALNDPNPVVVVEVIDSLEFAGDESIVPRLAPLLEHPDPRVREATAEAIDFLGDSPATP